jgi:dynactin-4
VCVSPLIVNLLDNPDADQGVPDRHILACPYCHWSTIETGIEFEKHTGVYSQIARIANGGKPIPTSKERDKERERRKELEARQRDSRNPLSPSSDSTVMDVENHQPPTRDDLCFLQSTARIPDAGEPSGNEFLLALSLLPNHESILDEYSEKAET